MANLGQLKTAVVDKIGSINATDDETKLERWINEGVVDILLRTGCRVRSATMTLTAGTGDYTLSADILAIKEVYVTGAGSSTAYRMTQVSPQELLDWRLANAVASSNPSSRYALNGNDYFMVWPTPAAADVITLYYVPRPTALSGDSDTPSEIPAEFHKAIELFACSEAADYDDDQSSAQGERYRERYEEWLNKIRRSVSGKGNTALPTARLGRRVSIAARNDVYP